LPDSLQFRVDDLRALSKTFKGLSDGKELAKLLRKELKVPAQMIQTAERRKVLSLPSKRQDARRGRLSLRKEFAGATRVRVSLGKNPAVAVELSPKAIKSDRKGLPWYLEGNAPLRHPVFAARSTGTPWVTQTPMPYWEQTAEQFEPEAIQAGNRVLDAMIRRVEGR
jgi:hypothetical protein